MPFSHLANIRLYVMTQYIVGKSKEICPVQYYIATIMLAWMPQLNNAYKKTHHLTGIYMPCLESITTH